MRLQVTGTNAPTRIEKQSFRPSIFKLLNVPDGGPSARGSTFWKSLTSCPREHALIHEAGLRPLYAGDPLTLGWAWHYVLEQYYQAQHAGAGAESAVQSFAAIETLEASTDYKDIGSKLRAMFNVYLDTYEMADSWKILAIEETLTYQGAFEYSARLDLVVHDLERNSLWVVEHKSARTLSAELLDNYQLDMQILGQVFLVRRCLDLSKYPRFAGVRVNITTTGQKLPQVARVEVSPSDAHIAAFARSQQGLVRLRNTAKALHWPQYLGHCSGYARGYSRCTFFDLCHDWPSHSVDDWANPQTDLPPTFTRKTTDQDQTR